jgi:hypothetical protein
MMKVGDLVRYCPPDGRNTWLKGLGVITDTRDYTDGDTQVRVSFPNSGTHAWMFKANLKVINEAR